MRSINQRAWLLDVPRLLNSGAVWLAALILLLPSVATHAIPLVGTDGSNLYKFDSQSPGTVATVQITGMVGGDKLVGVDYRPATGELYGTGRQGHLYKVNPATGAAEFAFYSFVTYTLSGVAFGTDISAVDDKVRVVSHTGQNLRLDPSDGSLVASDTPVSQNGIAAISYSNGYPGATSTTCYGINATAGTLVRIGSVDGEPNGPETGIVTTVGSLGFGGGIDQTVGFDVGPNGVAYAAINFGGALRLYTINLNSGAASQVGQIGGAVSGFASLTAQTGPVTYTNSATILVPDPNQPDNFVERASLYPSTISVAGLTGVVSRVRVAINDFRHKRPGDVDMLLVSPDGTRKMLLWSDAGGDFSTCGQQCNNGGFAGTTGRTVLLDDFAPNFLPLDNNISNGSYKPANHEGAEQMISPAPPVPYAYPGPSGSATFASAFNGTNPNGTWSLYVQDDISSPPSGVDDFSGRINSGWSIELSTGPACILVCPAETFRGNTPGQCGTAVNYEATTQGACGPVTYSIPPGSFFPVGTTKVDVSTGYGAKCSFNVTVTDFQPPAITCNSDITVQAPSGQTSAVVTYPDPMASDNCSGVTAKYDPPSGSSFPVGTTTVQGTATDASGRTMTCSFKVNVTDTAAPTPTPPPPSATKLANISTRLRVETGDNVLIGGFIVTGAEPKRLMVRAIGPSLAVGDPLLDPNLELFNGAGDLVAANNNWKDAPNQQEIIDTSIAPSNDFESAVLTSLDPGAYTAIVSGVNGGMGVGLVEAYDLALNANSKLANIATRGRVQTEDNVMIGGFIVLGPDPQKLVVRAIGPSLPIGNKLTDPTLQLFNSNGDLLGENDNWRSDQEADITATGIAPSEDAEAALLRVVGPDSYTAIVRGVNETTGVAVVEVYALDN